METQRRDFTKEEIDDAWKKAKVDNSYDSNVCRKDYAGALIHKSEYGNTNSQTGFGWEIDHIKPLAKGGTYDKSNLCPLQWNNNRTKGDNYPSWQTSVSSERNNNILKTQNW